MTITAAHLTPPATVETAKVRHRLAIHIKCRISRCESLNARDNFAAIDYAEAEFRGAIDLAFEIGAIDWVTRVELIRTNAEMRHLHGVIVKWHRSKVAERGTRPDVDDFVHWLERAKRFASQLDTAAFVA